MKQFFTFVICILITTVAMAQMPQAINYQAVARNNSGQALANQAIKVRLSIVNTAGGNATLYSETRNVTTNTLGLFNVQIGGPGALSTTGNFATVSWANNTSTTKALKVELDINNSGAFTDMGTQSLVTVPFAFAADKAIDAISIGGHYVDTNTPNVGDVLKWSGSAWVPTNTVAAPMPFIGFRAQKSTYTQYTSSFNGQPIIFNNEAESANFDSSNVYNPNTGKFKAPQNGMYYFNAIVNIYTINSNFNSSSTAISFLSSLRGSLSYAGFNQNVSIKPGEISHVSITGIFYLSSGEEISVMLDGFYPTVANPATIFTESTFQGYKIN